MKKKKIIIIGSSFTGYSTAVHLASLLSDTHEILVIDKKPEFIFLPSLVWMPFESRDKKELYFDTTPIYERHGIEFLSAHVYGFDLKEKQVYLKDQDLKYDYLVIASGARPRYESIKGLIPGENAWSVCCNYDQVLLTQKAWDRFLKDPGPLVIGAAQWAGYFFAAYEFLVHAIKNLSKHRLLGEVPIHFITSEPHLCHYGIDGVNDDEAICSQLFKALNIQAHVNSEVHEVKTGEVVLESGEHIDSSFTMIIPPFIGVDAVRTTRGLADEHGLIHVTDYLNHPKYPRVYAAGGAVSIPQMADTPIGLGVPRTLKSSQKMARMVAHNIACEIEGGEKQTMPTQKLYEQCKKDMQHISHAIFEDFRLKEFSMASINAVSDTSKDQLAIKKYLESSFSKHYIEL